MSSKKSFSITRGRLQWQIVHLLYSVCTQIAALFLMFSHFNLCCLHKGPCLLINWIPCHWKGTDVQALQSWFLQLSGMKWLLIPCPLVKCGYFWLFLFLSWVLICFLHVICTFSKTSPRYVSAFVHYNL